MNVAPKTPLRGMIDEGQLQKDRRTAVIVLAIVAVLMALMIWLASMSGAPAGGVDYWLMP